MKLACFAVIVSILLVSCGGNPEKTEVSEANDTDVFTAYEIALEGPRINFTDLVDEVELIRLEETEQSLLSSAAIFLETEQGYLLSEYTNTGMPFTLFSKTGEFMAKYDKSGDGPEEFRYFSSVWLRDGVISVHLKYEQLIKQYNTNWEFLQTLKVPEVTDQVLPLANGYAVDINHNAVVDSLKYDVYVYDKDFKLKSRLLPYEKNLEGFSMSSDANGFWPYKQGYTYMRTLSDTLYTFDGEHIEPLARFDLGSAWHWNNNSQPPPMGRPQEGAPVSVVTMAAYTHPQWFYLNCITNFGMKNLFINRATGAHHWLDFKAGESNYRVNVVRIVDDRLLVSISSEYVRDFLSQLSEEQITMRAGTTLDVIESSENPVLMWVRLKE